MEPRPHERGNSSGQRWPRPRPRASMEPRPHERGNYSDYAKEHRDTLSASMEPRPHERGNATDLANHVITEGRFNGATSSRTWKQRPPTFDYFPKRCFNGATSSRTWKLTTPALRR